VEFGRFAEQDRKDRGDGELETFDFPGFTHIYSKGKNGWFRVKRRTSNKKQRAKLRDEPLA